MSNQQKDGVNMAIAGVATKVEAADVMPALADESIALPSVVQETGDIVDNNVCFAAAATATTTALDNEEMVVEADSLCAETVVNNSQGADTSKSMIANLEPSSAEEAAVASGEHLEEATRSPSPTKETTVENETLESSVSEKTSQIRTKVEGIKSEAEPVQDDDKVQIEASKTRSEEEIETRPVSQEEQPPATTPTEIQTTNVGQDTEVERQTSVLTVESETDVQSQQHGDGVIPDATTAPVDSNNSNSNSNNNNNNDDECESSGDVDEDASCSLHGGGGGGGRAAGPVQKSIPSQHEPNPPAATAETAVVAASTIEASVEVEEEEEEEAAAMIAPMAAETTPVKIAEIVLTSNDPPVIAQVPEPKQPNQEVPSEAKVIKSTEEEENHEKENDKDNNEASADTSSSQPPPDNTSVPFVNEGLLQWERARQVWLSHQYQQRGGGGGGGSGGDDDDSSFSCKPAAPAIPLDVDEIIDVIFASPRQWRANEGGPRSFPQPVPLPQLVDLLQGMYVHADI
jgi:hypothetical protein